MSYEGGGAEVSYLGEGQFILCPLSHLEMQDFKNLKNVACSALIFNIHIFRLEIHAGFQVDIDFNTESNFFFCAVSFHPLVVTQNQPNP